MEQQGFRLNQTNTIRLVGLLYVGVILLAGFSQGYVRSTLVSPEDAQLTATKILSQLPLFRIGMLTDLWAFMLDALISVLLYRIFAPYGKTLAALSSSLRLLAHPAIASLNLLNHFMAGEVLSAAYMPAAFEPKHLEALSMLFIEAHRMGYLIAGAFFGLHCLLLGVQLFRTPIFPKVLGALMLVAGLGYMGETFGNLLFPAYETELALFVAMGAVLGEVSLALYFLIKGHKTSAIGMKY